MCLTMSFVYGVYVLQQDCVLSDAEQYSLQLSGICSLQVHTWYGQVYTLYEQCFEKIFCMNWKHTQYIHFFAYFSQVHHMYVPLQNIMKKLHDVRIQTVYLMHSPFFCLQSHGSLRIDYSTFPDRSLAPQQQVWWSGTGLSAHRRHQDVPHDAQSLLKRLDPQFTRSA